MLEVRNLTSLRQPSIRDISFDLHQGEILGIAGLVGAKRTDILETLFGIREKSSGTITLRGKPLRTTVRMKPLITVSHWSPKSAAPRESMPG